MSAMRQNDSTVKDRKKWEKGSMTVESTLLIPVIFYVLFCLIYILLYYMEYSVVQSITEQTVAMCMDEAKQKSDQGSSFIVGQLKAHLEESLLFAKDIDITAKLSGKRLQITVNAAEQIPFQEIVRMIGTSQIQMENQITVLMKNPVDVLRKRKLLKEEP